MAKCRSDLLERFNFTISLYLSEQTVRFYSWSFCMAYPSSPNIVLDDQARLFTYLSILFNLGCISHLCSKRFTLYGIAALNADHHRLNIDLFTLVSSMMSLEIFNSFIQAGICASSMLILIFPIV